MGFLQSGMEGRRIKRRVDNVTECEQVTTAVKAKDFFLVALDTASPSESSFLNHSAILYESQEPYCQICDCPFQEITDMLENKQTTEDMVAMHMLFM